MNQISYKDVIDKYPALNQNKLTDLWSSARSDFNVKIIVLDDDPTGIQTVHSIPVYTDWEEETVEMAFKDESQLVFILTNSRSFTEAKAEQVYRLIAKRISYASEKYNIPYLLISRSDSTLRGHYPLETDVLRQTIEEIEGNHVDGEVIIPFFEEGGRLTVHNTHFVQQANSLVPAGETEFAKDRSFGFKSSHLGEWIEEKTKGLYKAEDVLYISLKSIRKLEIDQITEQLMTVSQFRKIVVNALNEDDITVFTIALIKSIQRGQRFLFRTAATFTKVIGDISSRPLLSKEELIKDSINHNGGLVVIGSHVKKTSDQLNILKSVSHLYFIEFDCHLVFNKKLFKKEIDRVRILAEEKVSQGITTVIYTKRERIDLGNNMQEEELQLSVEISNAVTRLVNNFTVKPKFLIAKGGITSSDIGTKGLGVKRATVAGQIAPGVPVWKTGSESKFPFIPYIIFPGNVGTENTLKDVVLNLDA
ncbi:four-carbon acid sugar kinase family protein [Cytobacillus sp. FSL H8-0458]|uniref:four-carbon acid sugar kinase family protein n=1 Tax=Cytobacillus sp. FSL H8-0458 TaxID=2975346 RepID=UPI0030F9F8EE